MSLGLHGRRYLDSLPPTQALVSQQHLNDQFGQLVILEDEDNPDFVADIVRLFISDSESRFDRLQQARGVGQPRIPGWVGSKRALLC